MIKNILLSCLLLTSNWLIGNQDFVEKRSFENLFLTTCDPDDGVDFPCSYGQLYNLSSSTPTITLTNAPTTLFFDASDPVSNDLIANPAEGSITISEPGIYFISFNISFDPLNNNRNWHFQTFVNEAQRDEIQAFWDPKNNEETIVSMNGLLKLSAGDVLSIKSFISGAKTGKMKIFANNVCLWRVH